MAVVVKGADAVVTTADCAGCRIGSLATLIKTRATLLIQRRFHVDGEDVEAALRFLFNAMAPKSIEDLPLKGRPRII